MIPEIVHTQVAIIGAGYSGIAAAKLLHKKNIDFLILEARDRLGGRVYTHQMDSGLKIELGAQWVGPGHDHIYEWIREAEFHTFDTFDNELHIYEYANRQSYFTSQELGPDLSPVTRSIMRGVFAVTNFIARAAWEKSKRSDWLFRFLDSYTVADTLNIVKFLSPRDHYLMKKAFEISSAQRAEDMSLLHALYNIYTAGDFEKVIKVKSGAQQSIIREGAQCLLKKISAPFSEQIMYSQPVGKISQKGENVSVYSADYVVHAKKIIVAIPPNLWGKIDFGEPNLPFVKQRFSETAKLGRPIKCFAIYERPFWRERSPFYREKALSGQVITDRHPFVASYDCSPDSGQGVLLFFVKEDTQGEFTSLTDLDKKRKLVDQIVRLYGPEGREILGFKYHIWDDHTEKWSGGGYAASFGKGDWTTIGDDFRKPVGNIHWAGTEMATRWYGYMEGAIDAGYTAANEVIKELQEGTTK